jgi:hypothetical protein
LALQAESHRKQTPETGIFGDGGRRKLRLLWWPTLLGLGFAAFVAIDLFSGAETGADLGPIVAASGLVYLGAATLQRPRAAWPLFFLTVLVITASKLGWVKLDSTWLLFAMAGAFLSYGLLRTLRRPSGDLSAQAIGMAAFGAVAALALMVNEVAGAFLVAIGLFAHAGWDAYHHWTEKVVTRSLAEFCFVLDATLGALIVFVTVRSMT